MRESKIEKHLRTEVEKLGGWMEKHISPGRRGVPDNLVMWDTHARGVTDLCDGNFIAVVEFIETKAPDGVYKVLQQRDHERRRKMGFAVHVIWNMEQAEAYLKLRGKK